MLRNPSIPLPFSENLQPPPLTTSFYNNNSTKSKLENINIPLPPPTFLPPPIPSTTSNKKMDNIKTNSVKIKTEPNKISTNVMNAPDDSEDGDNSTPKSSDSNFNAPENELPIAYETDGEPNVYDFIIKTFAGTFQLHSFCLDHCRTNSESTKCLEFGGLFSF